MKKLRVGIIGFGMIGKVHAFGYRAFPFYARDLETKPQIAMVATAHAETARVAGEMLGCRSVTDWHEITENPEIDAVHICTPNREHVAPLLSAIENRKHIYCDKPITACLDEALRVEEALRRTDAAGAPLYGKTHMMTFHLRFIPALIEAKRLINAGRLGHVFQYRAAYRHGSNASPDVPYKWKFDRGGGTIRDLGSHLSDLIGWLVGLPDAVNADTVIAYPTRIDPVTGRKRKVESEDAFTMMTRKTDPGTGFATRGVIEATKLAVGSEDEMFLEIYGEKGALRFSLADAHFLYYYDTANPQGWMQIATGARYAPPHSEFPSPKSVAGWTRAHTACLTTFVAAIERGIPAEPDLFRGICIQKFLDAVEESATRHNWVDCATRVLPSNGK
ncbi:MAG: Gfo/Idh/MocA family protein [Thermoguttaceae bacterium]|jgi:predicted dehydrogenase